MPFKVIQGHQFGTNRNLIRLPIND